MVLPPLLITTSRSCSIVFRVRFSKSPRSSVDPTLVNTQAQIMTTVAPVGDGVALLYCAIVLLVLSWVTFLLRIGVRVWRKAWGMDDYLMLLGIVSGHSSATNGYNRSHMRQLLSSVTASICIVCSFYGSGQFSRDLPPATMAVGIKVSALGFFSKNQGAD